MEDCIEWSGSRQSSGYGRVWIPGVGTRGAHRVAYVEHHGLTLDDIEGEVIRHFVCSNPPCVNPEHLRRGTHADNMQDRVRDGNHFQVSKAHCPSGHEDTPENTYLYESSRGTARMCRACNRERQRSRRKG